MDRIAQAAPSQIKPGMILRSFVQATGRTPALLQVDLRQAIGGFMTLAELGLPLTPTLGMAHMIPFRGRKKVNDQWVDIMTLQIIIGYQGLLDLALRSGQVGGIHAEVVMPGDLFDYEFGTKQYLKHRPTGKAPAGAAPSHAWAIGHLRGDVEPPFEVMPYSKVLQIRDRSQAYIQALEAREKAIKEKWKNIPATYTEAPWIKHEQAMARKTVLRQLAKMLPKSVELQSAISIDEPDRGYVDFGPVIDLRPGEFEGGLPIEGDEQDPATAFGVREHIGEATTKAPDSGAAPTQAASTTGAGAAETTQQASDPAAKRGPGRPPKAKEPEPPAEDEPPPNLGDFGQAAASTEPPPNSTPAAVDFEAYLFDETGEVISDVLTDPLAFARAYANLLATCDAGALDQIMENNLEARQMAGTLSAPAMGMMDRAVDNARAAATNAESQKPGNETALPPAKIAAVAVPHAGGKPDWKAYVDATKMALGQVGLTLAPSAWIEAQLPTLATAPQVPRIGAVRAIVDRLKEIGQLPPESLAALLKPAAAKPPAEPAPAKNRVDVDRAYLADRKSDLDNCKTIDEIREYTNRAGLKERLQAMLDYDEGRTLVTEFRAHAEARFNLLKPKPAT